MKMLKNNLKKNTADKYIILKIYKAAQSSGSFLVWINIFNENYKNQNKKFLYNCF